MDDKYRFQHSGLKWLYEMELLDDPQLINNLKQNVMSASRFRVRECEFIMSQEDRKILIWIELNWFWKKFFLKQINYDIFDVLSQLLPNYQFRIVTDRKILDLAITKLKKSLKGGTYAVSSSDIDISQSKPDIGKDQKGELPEASDLLPDNQEHDEQTRQSLDQEETGDEVIKSDISSNEET